MPSSARYTCEITFHRAVNVPVSDLNDLSCDPYLLATISRSNVSRPDDSVSFRTATARRTLNPDFNAKWIVSGIPASGFLLTIRLFDEDPGNHDDKLGKAVLRFPDHQLDSQAEKADNVCGELKEGWDSGEREYKVHKRHGSTRTKAMTYIAKMTTRGSVRHRVRVFVSMRVLGPAPRAKGEDEDRIYTLGPHVFARHFSPLATRLTSVQAFKATRIQLTGPVPSTLRHRYVGFAPFVKAMFRKRGIEGMILHHLLHKQHRSIYKWDKNTVWGTIEDRSAERGEQEDSLEKADVDDRPNEALARKFLEMAGYGTDGAIFTYVIMLSGEWRFTETGDEFAIGYLSKHTMHADVALEIAYSGEFFVRRVRKSHRPSPPSQRNGDANGDASRPPQEDGSRPTTDEDDEDAPAADADVDPGDPSALPPSEFELVIDNDSGTYRPRKDLLPVLEEYLARPSNLGALGRIRAMDGFDEKLKKWKEARKEEKKRAMSGKGGKEGKDERPVLLRQASVSSSGSSLSSSDDGDAAAAATDEAERERRKASGQEVGGEGERKVLEEDARRAEDNGDGDDAAREETSGGKRA
ncbi:hypothetical protein C8Q80DRAFT_1266795 [Daedaleopsis nitida]|nr:hypothetical protein C8Q80DRAFT_1266795 [Daedaleopsis nitida]